MVFYHGQKEWTFREVQDHFSTSDQGLEAYIPKFTTCFTDLVQIEDNEIESVNNEALRATLLTQKYSKNSQELENKLSGYSIASLLLQTGTISRSWSFTL